MKLRNKKTGEIKDFQRVSLYLGRGEGLSADSLAELNEEWEDAPEEPKVGYIIDPMEEDCVSADDSGYEESDVERAKELGIWLETREEAEKAVEKLKAFKRLKDIGCRFVLDDNFTVKFVGPEVTKIVSAEEGIMLCDDYRLLFGGGE